MVLASDLRKRNVTSRIDDSSASIGRRYARNDELGTPFGITIDFQTVADGTVTLRERDSTKQIRESVSFFLKKKQPKKFFARYFLVIFQYFNLRFSIVFTFFFVLRFLIFWILFKTLSKKRLHGKKWQKNILLLSRKKFHE